MRPHLGVLFRTSMALALAGALPGFARAASRGHLVVKGEQECATCHRTDTPDLFREWEQSPHGFALVKCFVCHGSTGTDFRAKPDASSCRSCHPAAAEALAARPVKDCFACHAPHSLSADPHRPTRTP